MLNLEFIDRYMNIPTERLKNKDLIDFIPYGDSVLIFEPPFEQQSNISIPFSRTQCNNRIAGWESQGVWGEIVAFGSDFKNTDGLKIGDMICYSRTNSKSKNPRHRFGKVIDIRTSYSREENWQEDKSQLYACLLSVHRDDILGVSIT